MSHWICGLASKLLRRTAASSPRCRPTLEQLEDRCVPSANMMMSMGMTTPSMNMNMPSMDTNMPSMNMNMPTMNMPSMNVQTTNMQSSNAQSMGTNTPNIELNPATLAAINQFFVDFSQTLQQVMSSNSAQQFVANEVHMIEVITLDIAQIRMAAGRPDHMG
jgi:hypothetical protein